MTRSTIISLFTACASLLLAGWPLSVRAQTVNAAYLTIDDITAEFTEQGFHVSTPTQWGLAWMWSHVSSVTVSDAADPGRRTAMVLVFPNAAAASLIRQSTAEQEQVDDDGGVVNVRGPHIVRGYGYSVWFENVAIVQASPESLVDPDFVAALTTSQYLLQRAPSD